MATEQLQMFLDAMPHPIFWVDNHLSIQGCSQLFCDLIGIDSPSLLPTLKKEQVFSAFSVNQAESLIQDLLNEKHQSGVLYDCLLTLKNEFIWTQKRLTQIKSPKNNNTIGVLCTVVDISEQVYRNKYIENYLGILEKEAAFYKKINQIPLEQNSITTLAQEGLHLLKESTNSHLCVWASLQNSQEDPVVYHATTTVNANKLSQALKKILPTIKHESYLSETEVNILKESIPNIQSAYAYTVKATAPQYEDSILLINPSLQNLTDVTTKTPLLRNFIHIYHDYNNLKATMA
jgi:hypothetical protein